MCWYVLSAAALTALAAPRLATAELRTWRFDPVHTQIWFSVDHEGFSHPIGRLRVKQGWFQFDPDDWSANRVDVVIDLVGADMGDAKWNAAVKGRSFLDVARWPSARYISQGVEKKSATSGVIHGTLYFHGEQKPLDVNFTLNKIGSDPYAFNRKAGFSAAATLERSVFGMTRYKDVVGNTVKLRMEIEALPARSPETSMTEAH